MSNAACWTPLIAPEDTSEEEQELLWHTCRLVPDDLRRPIIQVRAIADAYDRKLAGERSEELQEYLQTLKAKKASKPRPPSWWSGKDLPSGEEGEKLREQYGLARAEDTGDLKGTPGHEPAKQKSRRPKAKK